MKESAYYQALVCKGLGKSFEDAINSLEITFQERPKLGNRQTFSYDRK